jgi:hypothetical protein
MAGFVARRLVGVLPVILGVSIVMLIPEEAAPQFLDDAAPRNGMMPPPNSEMMSPPITE